jgi:formate dehydrogenase major subunit
VIIVIGARPTENHPVAATFFKQAAKRGAKIIVMDPRGYTLMRHAWKTLRFNPGRDVALLNALIHTIVEEGLYDRQYVQAHTEDFEKLREHIRDYSPEKMAPVCGVDAATLREVARTYARAEAAIIFWGMGISQHTHGTDNARCLIALSLITGQVGRPGTGLHPLRGQNNVQGASDAGLIPMFYPDYQSVEGTAVRAKFEALWHTSLDDKRGLTVVDHGRGASRRDRACTSWARTPRCRTPMSSAGASQLGIVVRTLSDPRPRSMPMSIAGLGLAEKDGTVSNTNRQDRWAAALHCRQCAARLWIVRSRAARADWSYTHPRTSSVVAVPSLGKSPGSAELRGFRPIRAPRTGPARSSLAMGSRPPRAEVALTIIPPAGSATPNIRWC